MVPSTELDLPSDPRIRGEYVRRASIGQGTLTLVGVVHDHPASIYRVQRIVEAVDPEVLALELPPISMPLFEWYAETDQTPPTFGGEMSAAIQAAGADSVVGIDRPTSGFFGRLGRNLLRERPSWETVREVLSSVASTTKHAGLCRLAAGVARRSSVRLEVDSPAVHDVNADTRPEVQARDEREQVERARSFMNAFRDASPSRAAQLEDAARESEMAARLAEHGEQGDTVAIVGIAHLESLAERLDATAPPKSRPDTQ